MRAAAGIGKTTAWGVATRYGGHHPGTGGGTVLPLRGSLDLDGQVLGSEPRTLQRFGGVEAERRGEELAVTVRVPARGVVLARLAL